MTEYRSHSAILLPLLANAASLHTLFMLFAFRDDPKGDHPGMLIWWGCLILTYAVLALFLRHPHSMRGVLLIAGFGLFLQLGLTLLFAQRCPSFFSWLTLLAMWSLLVFYCCSRLLEGVKPESLVRSFESTTFMLFVAAIASSVSVLDAGTLPHLAAGVLFSLIALARMRSGHSRLDEQAQNNHKGAFLLIALMVGLGGCVVLFCMLLTDSAVRLMTRITSWVYGLLLALLHALERFFLWLASLIPEQERGDMPGMEEPQLSGLPTAELSTENAFLFHLLIGAVVVFVLILLILLWWKGGIHRLPRPSRSVRRATRKRHSPLELLLQLWHRLTRHVAFQLSYLQKRSTAPGLLVWLERRLQRKHIGRKKGETSRMFLNRIQELLPQCQQELNVLADCLDRHYFGSGQTLSKAEITAMRKKISQELHQR